MRAERRSRRHPDPQRLDDILTIPCWRAFVPEGGMIASPTPSYILYKSLAEIQGCAL